MSARQFWEDYEHFSAPAHLAKIKSLKTGKEESFSHRDQAGHSSTYQHVLPAHLSSHAKDAQAFLASAHPDKIETINGVPHVTVYRGLSGKYASKLLEKFGAHDFLGNPGDFHEVNPKSIRLKQLPFASWSLNPSQARDFASLDGPTGLVVKKKIPLKDVLHLGFGNWYDAGRDGSKNSPQHVHESEQEVVVEHPTEDLILSQNDIHEFRVPNTSGKFKKPRLSEQAKEKLEGGAADGMPDSEFAPDQLAEQVKKSGSLQKVVLDPSAGYTIGHEEEIQPATVSKIRGQIPETKYIKVLARHGGKIVGSVHLSGIRPGHTAIQAFNVDVDPDHQRKGIASAMYSYAEKLTGLKMKPSPTQSPAGRMLWDSNEHNSQFGKSEQIQKAEPDVDTSFDFGENDPAQDALHQKALKSVARMRPEKQQVAQAWIDFVRGRTQTRPEIEPDLERHLARFGIVDPAGFSFGEDGRSLLKPTPGKRVSLDANGRPQKQSEGLRSYRQLDRDALAPFRRSEKESKDVLHGGAADDLDDSFFDPEQLKIGIQAEYQGGHKAPSAQEGNAPFHQLDLVYPADIYTHPKAAHFYGHGGDTAKVDQETLQILRSAKGQPDAKIKIYRAVPGGVADSKINPGDWVTPNKNYAAIHGNGPLKGDYKILESEVPARHLFTDANSIHEFGYQPSLDKASLDPGKTGRSHLMLPVGSTVKGKIKVKLPNGKTSWRSVRSGLAMDSQGQPVSVRKVD